MTSRWATDLVAKARRGGLDPIVGRDGEIRQVIQTLMRRSKSNPVLLGDAGVGKTAIVEGLAQWIVQDKVPPDLRNCSIMSVDLNRMVAGTSLRGQFEERMQDVLTMAQTDSTVILFIDELHTLLGSGKASGSQDAADIIKPVLARPGVRVIGATTEAEYRKHIESDPALERRFYPVTVPEPSAEAAVSMLKGIKLRYQTHHGVIVPDTVLPTIVKWAKQHFPERRLPDSAIDLLDESCSFLRMQLSSVESKAITTIQTKIAATMKRIQQLEQERVNEPWDLGQPGWPGAPGGAAGPGGKPPVRPGSSSLAKAADLRFGAIPKLHKQLDTFGKRATLQEDHVKQVISERKRVAIAQGVESKDGKQAGLLKQDRDSAAVLGLEQKLNEHVVGQPAATKAVALSIMRAQAGLSDKRRPIACLMFLGSSGVGKTQLAKRLAVELFGSEQDMIRLDMSEYMEQHAVSRLIGSPPGYIGHDDGGQLTDAVRKTPHSVVLFDEIEKAHPRVLNVLLQVLDDARLTDSKGRTVSFKDCIIILTSNVGSEFIAGSPDDEAIVMTRVRRSFRPEFLNRMDNIIMFNPLAQEQLRAIVRLQVRDVAERLGQVSQPKISLTVSDQAADIMVAHSADKDFGARALRRYLEKTIVNPLSELILRKEVRPGASLLVVVQDGQLLLKVDNPKTVSLASEQASRASGERDQSKKSVASDEKESVRPTGSKPKVDGDLGPPPGLKLLRVKPPWGDLALYQSDVWPPD